MTGGGPFNDIPSTPIVKGRHFCIEPGCEVRSSAKGLCRAHYAAKYRSTSDKKMTGSRAKLSDEDIKDIKRRNAGFATQKEIATHFGVSIEIIRRVLNGTYNPSGRKST